MDNITIPDKTPIIYKNKVVGHTIGVTKCDEPINAVVYQFIGESPVSYEDYIKCQISTSSLALVFGEELKIEIC